ncbi:MAG: MOSC domain-containing protein [Betaproteobacteria bacterium HGW-Betaproteobacteria-6]|nr:MAG: MOSC domain-containing protein [Betaproteobacteria bacterium HGW-Betaproteobacteria-6]
MADVSLFIGGIRPLPDSGRPTGMYKQPAVGRLELSRAGFVGDQQADRRVHGGPEKAVHLYPARHYARLAERFPEAAPQLVIGSLGENISTADLDESDVRIGDMKIDERFASDGMAAFIAEHRLTGWYWRVVTPGHVTPGDRLELVLAAEGSFTLGEAMLCWQAHRPALADLEKLAASPGIAKNWQQKIVSRVEWLRKNPEKTSPAPVAFHAKPENP